MERNDIVEALARITEADWGSNLFGDSVIKADLRKQLFKIKVIDDAGYIHKYHVASLVKPEEVTYITSNGKDSYQFISGETKIKTNSNGSDYLTYTLEPEFPRFSKLVIDYLIGCYAFSEGKLYDVRGKQFKMFDDFMLQNRYGFKDATGIREVLEGIDSILKVKPVRYIEPFKIACQDFVIDLKENCIINQYPEQNVSYFKFYDVDYETAKNSQSIVDKFLNYVTADDNSLHNANLQTYYIAQVASGLRAKTNFFITKSGVRTGKGLRHIALSGLFNKIDVELDNLKSNGFEALQAWAMFAGGEMALATEQGDIQGDSMERVLKIIATEKTHLARTIGQNQSLVTLSSVLCVDTNRTVALSDEMDGRKVLIQYQDRPLNETDIEREAIFKPYWDAFTDRDKNPKISGCIGFLLNSLEYFNNIGGQYIWKNVEVFNDIDLDEFQIALINALQEVDFVQRTDNKTIIELARQVYGTNNNKLGKALGEIGVKPISKKVNSRTVRGYKIDNIIRFSKYVE
ncbi:phage resistance protein [Streptococcus hyovaginalis]